jgi:hypothetical protein
MFHRNDQQGAAGEAPLPSFIDSLPYFLTVRQAAYALGGDETPKTVQTLIKRRLLRATRIGGAVYIFTDGVRELRAARLRRSA